MNRYWIALSKDLEQVIVRVEATNQPMAVSAAEAQNPGWTVVSSGLLRKGGA